MKPKKDITSLFREHKHMEVQPSSAAWRRLERKLDAHRNRGARNVQRMMAMAASFLLLIVFVLIISMVVGHLNKNQMVYRENVPVQLEDLIDADVDFEAYRVVSFTHHLQDRMSAIEEGLPDRKLVPIGLSKEEAGRTSLPKEEKVGQLADFNWLIGRWEGEANGRLSVENWQQLNAQNLRGTGLIIHKRDTVFQETILLEDNGEEIVLWAQMEDQSRSFPFALTRYEGDKAVFSNAHMTFPQEIHLEKKGKNGFSMIYVNKDVFGMDKDQSDFLKHRNIVSKQKVYRNLEWKTNR